MTTKILTMGLLLGGLIIGSSSGNASAEPVEAGFGKIRVNGLLQFWYQNDNGATPKDTFRLRRADIRLSGEIKPKVASWSIMFDPAQVREDVGRRSPLQDFVVTLRPSPISSITFGQYVVPFGMEGLESSARLAFIERSALTSQFRWANFRDVGFTVRGDFKVSNVKIQPTVGLFNGEGQNRLDVNESMDFVGRLVVKPSEALHLGVAHYNGKSGTAEIDNFRSGGEIKFVRHPIFAYGEYAAGKSGGKERQTYYFSAGYKILSSLQGVVRHDWYDLDIHTKHDDKVENTIGLNYFIEKHHAKIQLNYVLRGEKGTTLDNDVVRLNVQMSY